MRKLVIGSPEITWPTVVGGSPTGGCGAFVSADRAGNVREVFPGGCDNAALQQPLADAILKWKLNAPVVKGVLVQVTSLMGFAYNVQVTQPPSVLDLSDHDARALASNTVEPNFPLSVRPGTLVEIEVSVDDDGTILGTSNPKKLDVPVFFAAHNAVTKWKFKPYLQDGKAVPFKATIRFVVPPPHQLGPAPTSPTGSRGASASVLSNLSLRPRC
jgi:hypothetical protein